MAQQTTQFPPGGSLLNWTPGFSTSGSPIRGIRIDNTSGSWLNLQIPSLPVQYIPPYTLAWTMTLLTPLSSVTIYSGGPFGSTSTNSGSNVSVYAYDQSVGNSNGNTYYTPVEQSNPLWANAFLGPIVPGNTMQTPLLPVLPNKSYRLIQWTMRCQDTTTLENRSSVQGYLFTTPIASISSYISLQPGETQKTVLQSGIILDIGLGLIFETINLSSQFTYMAYADLIYTVM